MSVNIANSFVRQYERDVHDEFQRMGTLLLNGVRHQKNVVGKSTTFQKIGKGAASTKARHGVVSPMNQDHTAIECAIQDFYAGDWVDKMDLQKSEVEERNAVAVSGAYAIGRKIDELIIDQLDTTSQTPVSWTVTSAATVRNSMLAMVQALWANDVPQDGQVWGALTPAAWALALTVEEFASGDFVGNQKLPFALPQETRAWLGVKWVMHTGLTGVGTNAAKVFVWHKNAVGFAQNGQVDVDISWHGDRAAYFVNHMVGGGACLIDDQGVIEGSLDDTASLPTS
ncbi:MAG: phage capsid protein [Alphaproteobacteria bacterium]